MARVCIRSPSITRAIPKCVWINPGVDSNGFGCDTANLKTLRKPFGMPNHGYRAAGDLAAWNQLQEQQTARRPFAIWRRG